MTNSREDEILDLKNLKMLQVSFWVVASEEPNVLDMECHLIQEICSYSVYKIVLFSCICMKMEQLKCNASSSLFILVC